MKENAVAVKSKAFALRIIKLYQLLKESHESVLSRELLKSGTSIGANVREALRAQSDADFISKLHIALKEADETAYWLEILHDTDYINTPLYNSLNSDCDEIIRILTAILKTKKENQIK